MVDRVVAFAKNVVRKTARFTIDEELASILSGRRKRITSERFQSDSFLALTRVTPSGSHGYDRLEALPLGGGEPWHEVTLYFD